jgi:peptidyl-tRNA hydrolase, PTH1 family
VCGALVATAGEILLVRPQTYMNRSGWAIRCLAALHALPNDRVLVVFDDVALPLGRVRLRPEGSPGGHRGMESVIASLRGQDVPRLRLGIAPPAPAAPEESASAPAEGPVPDLADFVLAPFDAAERAAVDALVERGAEAALCWAEEGAERAMAKFNALG